MIIDENESELSFINNAARTMVFNTEMSIRNIDVGQANQGGFIDMI
jgi:hypothetical protein